MPGRPMSSRTTSGRCARGDLEGRGAVVGDADLVAEEPQQPRQALGRVDVVVDDEDRGGAAAGWRARRPPAGSARRPAGVAERAAGR